MRFTRRLVDRRSSAVVISAYCLLVAGASCASTEEKATPPADSLDAALPDTNVAPDAVVDASPPGHPMVFDGGPLPVVCTSPPCARSIVTTPRSPDTDYNPATEGFCALLDDGTVACWGANVDGQLGRGEEAGTVDSATPARVVGLSNVVELDHTCARTEGGEVWCWGKAPNPPSDAGNVDIAAERAPVQIPIPAAARRIGVNAASSRIDVVGCADTDDGFFCWGGNLSYQIGPTLSRQPASFPPTRIDLPPGAPILDIVVGGATFVLREDASTLSWGSNEQLARVSSLAPDPYPMPTELGGPSSVDLASNSGCATVAGTGYCWPSRSGNPSPLPVVAPEPLVRIATTNSARWCAVGASGAVYCWGDNSHGQAGDGTKAYAYDAVKVQGLPAPAAEVRTMPLSTCALLTTGKVYCWGNNFFGQLGTGAIKGGSLTPQNVVLP